jgi:AcrR family transcriptional regulator
MKLSLKDATLASPRVQRTRQRLLVAAAELFATQGNNGATMRTIAEAAGGSELKSMSSEGL